MRPLFLLSLPRSGSTFVQRVLASHNEIATASEPWFLLPLLYAERTTGVRAEYWHVTAAEALEDFRGELSGGPEAYREELAAFVSRVYARAAPAGASYFLDKTPRYHLIAEELPALLPDARFVFLWRNPLAVLASFLDTFRGGRFEPHHFAVDLFDGPRNLVAARRAAGDRAVCVRYEDLVADGESEWARVFGALGLEFDPTVLERFGDVQLRGRYGDPTGIHRYQRVSTEPVERWRATLAGPVRRAWCARWLERLGDEVLGEMGYDAGELLFGLDAAERTSVGRSAADLVDIVSATAQARVRAALLRLPESPQPVGGVFAGRRSAERLKAAVRRRVAARPD